MPVEIPSFKTHTPMAVEAMIFGLPVVATNRRGLPDIVVDGETGFLVPPKDAESIAEHLVHAFLFVMAAGAVRK